MGSDVLTSDLRLDPAETAILVVDMQNDFLERGAPIEVPKGRTFAGELSTFLNDCRDAGASIVFTKQVLDEPTTGDNALGDTCVPDWDEPPLLRGSRGAGFYDGVEVDDADTVIEKQQFSAFFDTDLDRELQRRGIEHVVMTGVTTANCVAMTARGASFHGYRVIFLPELTGSIDYPDAGFGTKSADEIQEAVCTVIAYSVGTLASAKDVIEAFERVVESDRGTDGA